MAIKSLKKRGHQFSETAYQLGFLENGHFPLAKFEEKLSEINLYPLKPTKLETFQINVGKMCNQVCRHCHVDAGPDRKEIMSKETMAFCLDAIKKSDVQKIDITGGAPEMNPHFRWFVEQCSTLEKHIIVRSNLTIIFQNSSFMDLPDFYKKHKVEVVSSLPFYKKKRTDSQRGDGVFDKSIRAIKWLNEVGFGIENSGLELNLVYNPAGAFLPADQTQLERDFKLALMDDFGISFNNLFAITNLPVSRFLEYLVLSENYEKYMQKLIDAFNPNAAKGVMCRNTISVSWDGFLYDCDFNQMLDLKIKNDEPLHVRNMNEIFLNNREIKVGRHCFGCTAGAGSSCGGAVA